MSEERTIQIDSEKMNNPELSRKVGEKLYFDQQTFDRGSKLWLVPFG